MTQKQIKNFNSAVGKVWAFYGVDNNQFKLAGAVFEAIEDENDGYRSYLESVVRKSHESQIFFKRRLANVLVMAVEDGYFRGHHLVDDVDGHVWLKVGTSNIDDYYPYFTFEYTPKEPKK